MLMLSPGVRVIRKLLPSLPPSQFKPWILPFGRKIVTMSSKYPYVSGFYKLLAICFTICKKSQYFKVCAACCSVCMSCCGGVQGAGGLDEDEAMETESDDDKRTCFLLFRNFTKEVSSDTVAVMRALSCQSCGPSGCGTHTTVQGGTAVVLPPAPPHSTL